ncbi:aminotransferase class I/II-fold pyridoxal phosphate-dependent enzyme [Flexivirga sp. ID2601S]|uniref:cysteine-S-conjugate beta-lyase n=2 Tax=Flexivirga aerilata TaxID=1656889 RepID=A0A849AIC3_9MICO|nr:aminotransferase class I/II-fold pyridoxal phosphate-dependent enzyme [Flexivirga aerilata]NNG39597.1 aminotransferase class I/II-fold pyridoxal phosphate-dependent enzyme [Flexivirga aerilata]
MQRVTVDQLRARGSVKWSVTSGDQLGAFIAESDLPLAPSIRAAITDAVDRGLTGYLPDQVAATTAAATAAFQQRRFGWGVDPGDVRLLPDVLAAFQYTATQLVDPATPIVLPTPAYMPFLQLPGALGRELRTVPMDRVDGRHVLDPQRLADALDGGGLLVLINPHNPTGQVATRDELLQIADVVERTGSTVFADEIHSPLVYPGAEHLPYASLDERTATHTVTAVSASKGWNLPGLACAQLILTTDRHRELWTKSPMVTRHGTSPLGAVAATAAYDAAGVQHLDGLVDYLRRGRDSFARKLAAATGLGYTPPAATYIHWIDLRGLDIDPATVAARTGVLGVNGTACGTPGFLRLTLATSHEIVDEIADRLVSLAGAPNG